MDSRQHSIQLGERPGPDAGKKRPIDDDGRMSSELYRAVCKGRKEEAMALLLGGAAAGQVAGIDQVISTERNTVLHLAAKLGHDELIQELCASSGGNILLSSQNSVLDTPLHCAARAGHDGAVSLLIQLAQDCEDQRIQNILGCKNEAGDTALHLAARFGHDAVVKVIVSKAPGLASEVNNAGISPLYLAVMSGSVPAVKAITTACSDASAAGPSSQNALHAAVFQGSGLTSSLIGYTNNRLETTIMIRRRFVNLVLDTYIGRRYAYALHRINVSSLFNPRKPKTPKGEGTAKDGDITRMMVDARLPHPAVTFYPSLIYAECMSLGSRNPDHMVTIDQDGRGVVYDVASRSFDILPTLHGPIYEPISLTVGGRFYMMKSSHSSLEDTHFEALIYGRCPDTFDLPEVWYWRSLPMPPFFLTRPSGDRNGRWSYDEVYEGLDEDARPRVTAYTAVNDKEIWVSFGGETYSFDTVSSEWTKLGDWALPFEGRAEYSAEHKTWFGLSSSNARLLSTSDLLQSCGTSRAPPQLCNVWKEPVMPEWYPCSSCLLPLGSGRFCIAKVFETGQASNNEYDERFLLLTGVEVERCGKVGNGGGTAELRLVKHRTCRYNLTAMTYIRVF